MFETEKHRVKELSDGIVEPHVALSRPGKILQRYVEITLEWPHSELNAQNHLTDVVKPITVRKIPHARALSINDDRGLKAFFAINPGDGTILTYRAIAEFDSESLEASRQFPPTADSYELLITELAQAAQNPDLVTVWSRRTPDRE